MIQVDRGGQVTYHGPGQLVTYLLLDVRRLGLGVRELVSRIEQSLIGLLASYDVQAVAKPDAPGCLRRRGEDRLPRPAHPQRLFLPWPGAEPGHGPATVPTNQSLRLRRMPMTQLRDLVGPVDFAEV